MGSRDTSQYVWQDREVRFDIAIPATGFELRASERIVDSSVAIEDTKGNAGEPGTLVATNLRLIWVSTRFAKTNLSIGYDCIVSFSVRAAAPHARLRGVSSSLFVLTQFEKSRLEFVFSSLAAAAATPRIFASLQAVHSVYQSTRLYRDLRLRAAIVHERQLSLLPAETLYRSVNGVWNLSADQGNLGSLVITNVRVVWFATMADNFNVSIPFVQIKSTRVRDSKFGLALVIETMPQSGSYVLGFRIDPADQLQAVAKELKSVHAVFARTPVFGVDYEPRAVDQQAARRPTMLTEPAEPLLEADDDVPSDTVAMTYLAADQPGDDRPIDYCADLGLAIERLPDGIHSIDQLWQ